MYPVLNRCLDISLPLLGLLLFLPVGLPICLLLWMTGDGEVFYFQERIGYKNKRFHIWKFATMLKNSPNIGSGMITLRNDDRVTPLGKFLRLTKLNEIPQIINIVKGDMSIVGPRPLVDRTFNAIPENLRPFIYNVKPGITGIGSIVFRDEEKLISASGMHPFDYYQSHIAPYKSTLELWYQDHASIKTDLLLIFLTAWQILSPHSNLVYRVFKNLPPKPKELCLEKDKGTIVEIT